MISTIYEHFWWMYYGNPKNQEVVLQPYKMEVKVEDVEKIHT